MAQAAEKVRTPGRPKSVRKRREILRAAVELFTEKGYEGTSVDDIAQAAGVSKQTVYSHFGNKETLFALAVETKCKQSGIDPDLIDTQAPPETMLLELGRRFVGLLTSPEAVRVHCVCTTSAETYPELGRLFFEHGPLQTVEVVAGYLADQHRRKKLYVPEPGHAAWQFLCMLKGEAQMRAQFNLRRQSQEDLDAYIKSCVAMFLRAYAPRT